MCLQGSTSGFGLRASSCEPEMLAASPSTSALINESMFILESDVFQTVDIDDDDLSVELDNDVLMIVESDEDDTERPVSTDVIHSTNKTQFSSARLNDELTVDTTKSTVTTECASARLNEELTVGTKRPPIKTASQSARLNDELTVGVTNPMVKTPVPSSNLNNQLAISAIKPGARGEVPSSKLKDELRNKIQCRRLSRGADELRVTFDPPRKYSLTPDEKDKYEKRKQRNRDSANRSRLKRKFQLEYLEKEEEKLTKENQELTAKVTALGKVKARAEQLLSTHKCNLLGTSGTNIRSSAHAQLSGNSEDYNRGWAAFMKLSPDKQLTFLKAYAKRMGIQPGTSTNG